MLSQRPSFFLTGGVSKAIEDGTFSRLVTKAKSGCTFHYIPNEKLIRRAGFTASK